MLVVDSGIVVMFFYFYVYVVFCLILCFVFVLCFLFCFGCLFCFFGFSSFVFGFDVMFFERWLVRATHFECVD